MKEDENIYRDLLRFIGSGSKLYSTVDTCKINRRFTGTGMSTNEYDLGGRIVGVSESVDRPDT